MPADLLDRVLAGLDAEQREAVEAPRGPVCILAGAGTGKTRAVTHRIAYQTHGGLVAPQHVLAVTFTTRAAGELRSRLRGLGVEGVQARTFHSAALRQLQYFWPRISGGPRPSWSRASWPRSARRPASAGCSVSVPEQRDLASEIEWAKAALVEPADYAARAQAANRLPPLELDVVRRVFAAYEEVNAERGQLDFEDLLLLTAGAIETDRGIAAEVHERYRHFMVDEYQDVSPLQQRLLDAWLGDRDDLCVVGDPNQTIYSFTGASPSYLRDFGKRFEGATVVRLVRDYRSTTQVVGLANRVIPGRAAAGAGRRRARRRPSTPTTTSRPRRLRSPPGSGAAWRRASPLREIAVLFRVNAQSEVYEAALTQAGVPYVLRGGERFFDRPEVREAVVLLRGAARSAADHDTATLTETVTTCCPRPASRASRRAPPGRHGTAGSRCARSSGWPRSSRRPIPRPAWRSSSPSWPRGPTPSTRRRSRASRWPRCTRRRASSGTRCSWSGWSTAPLPITHATTPEQVEEERRLLYVGITRARRQLALSWALARAEAVAGRASRRASSTASGR